MAQTHTPPVIEFDGLAPDEAFAALGNETRVAIIRALWEANAHRVYDDIDATDHTISFSELRRAVNIRDNGQFNYHLSKLVPHFVRQTEAGYRLSEPGRKVARAVVANAGGDALGLTESLEGGCPFCGGALQAGYEDHWLRVKCTACPGEFGDSAPDGTLFHAPLARQAIEDQSSDEALSRGIYRCMLDLPYLMQGMCRECASTIDASLSICETHNTDDGPCAECNTMHPVWGELRCDTCRFAKRLPIDVCVLGLTPVIAFLYDREIDVFAAALDGLSALETQLQTEVSVESGVTVSISDGTESLEVTIDDSMGVREAIRDNIR